MQQSKLITLLGGGHVNPAILSNCLKLAPYLVAADGGADKARALGHIPKVVFGDMDSVSSDTRAALTDTPFVETPDQDRTDFDKALEAADAELTLGVGFMGGRLDHELACYNSLVRAPDRRCVLVGEEDICFHAPSSLSLTLPIGTRFSLFPMAEVTGDCTGLKWPVEGLRFAPWGRVGTSNETIAPRVDLSFDRPGMLVILPRVHLEEAIAVLRPDGARAQ